VGGLRNYGMTTFTKCEAKGSPSISELGDLRGEKRVCGQLKRERERERERENNSWVMIAENALRSFRGHDVARLYSQSKC